MSSFILHSSNIDYIIRLLYLFYYRNMGQNSRRCKKAIIKMKVKSTKSTKNFKDSNKSKDKSDNGNLGYVCKACRNGSHRKHHELCPKNCLNKERNNCKNTPSLKKFFGLSSSRDVSLLTKNT